MRVKVIADRSDPSTAIRVRAHGASLLGSLALGLIFVLWTYAGWHEAAYVVTETQNRRRTIPLALLLGTGIVTALYLAVNLAYLAGLGFDRAGETSRIAADVFALAFGEWGEVVVSLLIVLSCLGALNGMIFTSARIYAEMGADHPLFAPLGRWHPRFGTPALSLAVQGALTVGFIVFVSLTFPRRDGFNALVMCTAAVFWLLFLLTGIGLFVLRVKDPEIFRPFPVPLYPLTPIVFCVSCGAMVYASVTWARELTLVGLGVLLAGIPLYALSEWLRKGKAAPGVERLELTARR
jgi:amino acid transporter